MKFSGLSPDKKNADIFLYIRDFIPADYVALTHYYPDTHKQVVLALASAEGSSLLNVSVSVSSSAHQRMEHPDVMQIGIVDRAEKLPTARPWISKGLIEKGSSLLIVPLIVTGNITGAVIFVARDTGRFSREHAELMSLLRKPFAIAQPNSIRYQELLELKNLLAENNRFLQNELREVAGEEIIATAIYSLSPRKDGPFIKVNCYPYL